MQTIDDLRAKAETDLRDLLAELDADNRQLLLHALHLYGSVRAIPETIWDEIKASTTRKLAAALLLLMTRADDWTAGYIERQGVAAASDTDENAYAFEAARQAAIVADQTTDTVRDRLQTRVEDAALSKEFGDIGQITTAGIEKALDDVLTNARRATIATDQATQAMAAGQIGARGRMDDVNDIGQRVTIELLWMTERDNLVCPRCFPLQGQPESVWSLIFPNGPGPDAHPNCRCFLDPKVIVEPASAAA